MESSHHQTDPEAEPTGEPSGIKKEMPQKPAFSSASPESIESWRRIEYLVAQEKQKSAYLTA